MQIQTKYNIGDTVWTIKDNKAEKYKINKIVCIIHKKLTGWWYIDENNIIYHVEDYRWYDVEWVFDWENFRKSKEELIELL